MARPARHAQLPTRDGVSASCVALPVGAWPTVLDFLSERMGTVTRAQWTERMRQGLVLASQGHALPPEQAFLPGQRIYYYRHLDNEPQLPVQAHIVFEDEHLLVADKPHFMPVTPTGRYVQQSLLVQLKRMSGCTELSPVHRIDRETAGLVLLSKRPQDRDAYQALFRNRQVRKHYLAVAPWRADLVQPHTHASRLTEDNSFFRMREVPGEPNSETHLQMLRTEGERALYQLEPVTGKRHQLRVHMLSLGAPIEGDQFYPRVLRGPDEAEDCSHPLQLLAASIAFKDPVTGQERSFTSALTLNL
jgi:tRNA pseudouridine32 synthase/23S rRNA pseudouridine746 synthase